MNWTGLWRRREPEEELDEEIRSHFHMAVNDRVDRGEDPLTAERGARREFGNEALVRETTRDMWTGAAWERFAQDMKYGLRRIRSHKGFALLAILTLALGVGVNTAIFTLLRAVMFNSLPVHRPAELYRLGRGDNCCVMTGYQNGQDFALFSWELYQNLRDGTPEIRTLAAFQAAPGTVNVHRAGSSDPGTSFKTEFVSANYFDLFGIRPVIGVFFSEAADRRGAAPALVLSYRAWQNWLGGDPAILGESLLIKGRSFTIIGVAPPSFYGETLRADPPDAWLPAATEPLLEGANSVVDRPGRMWLYLMGRVPPGASRRAIESKINVEAKRWFYSQAGTQLTEKTRRAIEDQFIPLTASARGVDVMSIAYRNGLLLLMSLSSLVLLIACANVANLLLARAAALAVQNALKVALGASRARMLRLALIDSLVLSLGGGAAGLGLAFATTRSIVKLAFRGAHYVPIDATPSLPVLGFALLVAVCTGLLFGIGPAWMETRSDPTAVLGGASRTTPATTLLPQRILIVAQAMLSFVLLTGAGLLTESLWNLENQHFGFRTDQRIIVKVNAAFKDYSPQRATATYRALQEQLAGLPAVAGVGLAGYLPMTGNNRNGHIFLEGAGDNYQPGDVSYDRVGAGFFDAIGTRLLQGRVIQAYDQTGSRRVAVVNQTFVARYCKARDPIGMRFGMNGPEHAADYEIVGVVEDAKYQNTYQPPYATFFLSLLQPELNPQGSLASDSLVEGIAVHINTADRDLEPLLRKTIAQVDSNLAVTGVIAYGEQLARSFNRERLLAILTQMFAALALVLASIGLYGTVALSAGRRTAEIGVRMALGANRRQVVAIIVGGGLVPVALGIAIGIPASLVGARLIEHQLFGVSSWNPVAITGAIILLTGCAVVAALVPAIRAAVTDPMRALRTE
jgi:predicted permease